MASVIKALNKNVITLQCNLCIISCSAVANCKNMKNLGHVAFYPLIFTKMILVLFDHVISAFCASVSRFRATLKT